MSEAIATATAPGATEAPPITAKETSDFSDAFDELDKLDGIEPPSKGASAHKPAPGEPAPGEPTKPLKPAATPKPAAGTLLNPPEKPAGTKTDDVDDDPTVPHKSSELRPLYLNSKKTIK